MIAKFLPWFIGLGLLIALLFVVATLGYSKGMAHCANENIARLSKGLDVMERLTANANTASITLGKTINARIEADAKTASEIRHALKTTEHLRVDCVLPASVVLDLEAARNRANNAAASGLTNTLPAAAAAER